MKFIAIAISALLVGCSGVRMGIGYYKRPMPEPPTALRAIPPAVIEAIVAVIGSENFARIMEAALPPDEEVAFGIYYLTDSQ